MSPRTNGKRPRVTFGVRLPTSGPLASVDAVFKSVDALDKLGYDTMWTNDHISWIPESLTHFSAGSMEAVADQDPYFFESLTTASFILSCSKKTRVVVSALVIPLRDPRVLARQIVTIDALSGGRLDLAVGMGGVKHDFEVMQLLWEDRGKIGEEHLAALKAALSDAPLSEYHGQRINFSGAGFYPKIKGSHLWVAGGSSKAAFRRASTYGDGWIETAKSVESFAEHRRGLLEALDKVGRSPATITSGVQVSLTLSESYEKAVKAASRTLERRFGDAGTGVTAAALGTAQQAAEKLQEYIDAGADHIGLKLVVPTMEQYIETAQRVVEDVLPLLPARKG